MAMLETGPYIHLYIHLKNGNVLKLEFLRSWYWNKSTGKLDVEGTKMSGNRKVPYLNATEVAAIVVDEVP